MKICPQCSTTYRDEIIFCLNDGAKLVQQPETPSANAAEVYDDSDTIIRNEPIVIDFGKSQTESEPIMIDFSDIETVVHPPEQVEDLPQVTIIEKPVEPKGNYALFLVIGLFVGGGLVLLTLFLARSFFADNTDTNVNATIERGSAVSANAQNSANQAIENAAKHEKPSPSADAAPLNGSVIAVNAYIRALPNKDAAQLDVLPIGDRLKIERRENDKSPWYQVTCEHGTTGWMHGNTIAFN